mmetsp:Transcript_43844/g.70496  ORF Transcript_43844/g.70496 Transcript_43844/m.70496 type:complete len:658 (+) Transcript_43844:233-2206(+)
MLERFSQDEKLEKDTCEKNSREPEEKLDAAVEDDPLALDQDIGADFILHGDEKDGQNVDGAPNTTSDPENEYDDDHDDDECGDSRNDFSKSDSTKEECSKKNTAAKVSSKPQRKRAKSNVKVRATRKPAAAVDIERVRNAESSNSGKENSINDHTGHHRVGKTTNQSSKKNRDKSNKETKRVARLRHKNTTKSVRQSSLEPLGFSRRGRAIKSPKNYFDREVALRKKADQEKDAATSPLKKKRLFSKRRQKISQNAAKKQKIKDDPRKGKKKRRVANHRKGKNQNKKDEQNVQTVEEERQVKEGSGGSRRSLRRSAARASTRIKHLSSSSQHRARKKKRPVVVHDSSDDEATQTTNQIPEEDESNEENTAKEQDESKKKSENSRESPPPETKATTSSSNNNSWSDHQIGLLMEAHAQSAPGSRFWNQVAKRVKGKSAKECASRYNDMFPTPRMKKKAIRSRRCEEDPEKKEKLLGILALPKGRAPIKRVKAFRSVLRMADKSHGTDDYFQERKTPGPFGKSTLDVLSPPDVDSSMGNDSVHNDSLSHDESSLAGGKIRFCLNSYDTEEHEKADSHIQKLRKSIRSQNYRDRRKNVKRRRTNGQKKEGSNRLKAVSGESIVTSLQRRLGDSILQNESQPLTNVHDDDVDDSELSEFET